MSSAPDILVDRRVLKRRLIFWRIAAVVLTTVLIGVVLTPLVDDGAPGGDHVAVVPVEGIILNDPAMDDMLADIAGNDDVKAVIARIESPGGGIVGSEALYHGLRRIAESKPVVADMGAVAASGGYMAALGADHIIARRGTITGSIGVVMQTTNISRALESLGVRAKTYRSGRLKAMPNPIEPPDPAVDPVFQALVADMHAVFVRMVAARRPLTPEAARELSDGRVYTGRQALANGLVDALGAADAARRWLEETHDIDADLPVHVWRAAPEEEAGLRRFISSLLGKAFGSERLTLDGLLAVWHPES